MGNALIIGKVTAFQNLPASFSLFIPQPIPFLLFLAPVSSPNQKPAVAKPISGLKAAVGSQTTPGSRMRDWGSYSSPR